VLTQVHLHDKDAWARYYAVEKLTDQTVLTEIALRDTDKTTREKAQEVLKR
jgi:hypothetical protein